MAFKLPNRVRQSTTVTGTGAYTLDGNVNGWQPFSNDFSNGDTTWYAVWDPSGTDYEVGVGTFNTGSPNTLSRTAVLESSNSDAAVSWGAGTKDIFVTVPGSFLLPLNIPQLTEDTTPDGAADFFATYDTSASAFKKVKPSNLTAGKATVLETARNIDGVSFNGSANVTVIAPGTHAATGKTTPVDADELGLVDSEASNVLKKLTWANLKATLAYYGKQAIPIDATGMIPPTTNGAAAATSTETSTNKLMMDGYDFDASTIEYLQFRIRMPKQWNESTVTFQPVWKHGSTTTNFKVSWGLQGVALSDDDAGDGTAFGTAQYSNDTGGTTGDVYIGPESSAITIAGSPAENDWVVFRVLRKADDGTNDTLAIDATLLGITLFITTNAGNDA